MESKNINVSNNIDAGTIQSDFVNFVTLNLMSIHKNPTERVVTEPSGSLDQDEVWHDVKAEETLECSSIDGGKSFKLYNSQNDQHALLNCIDEAFNEHRPLRITPDDLLLPLVQAAALLIDEQLSKKNPILGIQPGKNKVKLVVRRDDFALGRENPWHEIFSEFGTMIKEDIGEGNYDMLRGNFTTTGVHQSASYDVSLMDACKSHYDYHNMFMCGIPEIQLLGTNKDWKNFRVKALNIAKLLDIAGWEQDLDDTIQMIIKCTEEGQQTKENLSFWCNLYRRGHHSGGEHIDGWINLFFPYVRNGTSMQKAKSSAYMKGEGWFAGRNVGSYPSSLSSAPVECNDRGRIVKLTYYAGQVGFKWDSISGSISPAWGWCITIKSNQS